MTEIPDDQQLEVTVRRRPRSRADAAATMRIAGHGYSDIAFALGFNSAEAARKAIEVVLAEGSEPWEREQHRNLQSRRYELLLKAILPSAIDTDSDNFLPAQRQAKDILDRLVALHGAAQAQEILVKSPAAKELAAFVGMVTRADRPDVEEDDPFASAPALNPAAEIVDAEWDDR